MMILLGEGLPDDDRHVSLILMMILLGEGLPDDQMMIDLYR